VFTEIAPLCKLFVVAGDLFDLASVHVSLVSRARRRVIRRQRSPRTAPSDRCCLNHLVCQYAVLNLTVGATPAACWVSDCPEFVDSQHPSYRAVYDFPSNGGCSHFVDYCPHFVD
jgi:hypothetical protein